MGKYSINSDFIIRRYGTVLLGYFKLDYKLRYYTIEGIAAMIIEEIEEKGTLDDFGNDTAGSEKVNIQDELDKLLKLGIVEVK